MRGDLLALGVIGLLGGVGNLRRLVGSRTLTLSRTSTILPPGWTIVLHEESEFALLDTTGTWRGNIILVWSDAGDNLLNEHCQRDLETLSRRVGRSLRAMVVEYSHVDDAFQGSGYGLLLYEHALVWAGSQGYALAPAACDGSSTSLLAQRTWKRLERLYPHEGRVVWGGP